MEPITELVRDITKHIQEGNSEGSKKEVKKVDDEKNLDSNYKYGIVKDKIENKEKNKINQEDI